MHARAQFRLRVSGNRPYDERDNYCRGKQVHVAVVVDSISADVPQSMLAQEVGVALMVPLSRPTVCSDALGYIVAIAACGVVIDALPTHLVTPRFEPLHVVSALPVASATARVPRWMSSMRRRPPMGAWC